MKIHIDCDQFIISVLNTSGVISTINASEYLLAHEKEVFQQIEKDIEFS